MWLNFVELVVLCYMFPSKAGGINGVELKRQNSLIFEALDLSIFGVMIRFVERVLLFVMPEKM